MITHLAVIYLNRENCMWQDGSLLKRDSSSNDIVAHEEGKELFICCVKVKIITIYQKLIELHSSYNRSTLLYSLWCEIRSSKIGGAAFSHSCCVIITLRSHSEILELDETFIEILFLRRCGMINDDDLNSRNNLISSFSLSCFVRPHSLVPLLLCSFRSLLTNEQLGDSGPDVSSWLLTKRKLIVNFQSRAVWLLSVVIAGCPLRPDMP